MLLHPPCTLRPALLSPPWPAGEGKVLVPALKRMPTKRGIYQTNLTADAFSVTLTYDNQPGAILPCCRQHFELGRWEVSGVAAVVAKHNESGKVGLHVRVDQGGLFHVDKADAALDVVEVIPDVPPPGANATANETAGGAANATGNATAGSAAGEEAKGGKKAAADEKKAAADERKKAADEKKKGKGGQKAAADDPASPAAAEAAMAKAQHVRRRTIRVPLNLTGGFTTPGLTAEQLAASRGVLRQLRERDEAKRETARVKNDLESYIIDTRDKVGGGGVFPRGAFWGCLGGG